MNGADEVKRFDGLKSGASQHLMNWDRMAPYMCPSRAGILTAFTPGTRINQNVFDSTTLMSAELMANFISSHIINPSQKWITWTPDDPLLEDDDEANEWCQESRDRFLKALNDSAFYAEGTEALTDYGGFGTGFLLLEEAPPPVNISTSGFRGFFAKAEKTGRFFISENASGVVDTAYREFIYTTRVMKDLLESGFFTQISDKVRNSVAAGKLDEPVKIIHAIVPRPKGQQTSGAKGMPWASLWIEQESKMICREGGYNTFPAAVPRYQKTPGETFGRGRGDLAFPDTWTLNTAKKMGLEDWALKIKPPIMVRHDSVFGTLKMTPGGAMSFNTRNQKIGDVAQPWQTGSHPEVSHINEEELRKSIRQIFFVEHILQLLEVNKSEMTALEFMKKMELLYKLLGPVYGRLRWEFLNIVSEIGFAVMRDARAFSPPPPSMLRGSGILKTTFNNPLDLAQASGEAESLALVLNDLAPLAQALGPEVLDWLDKDNIPPGIMKSRGLPARWTRSTKAVQILRQARQQQQEQELQTATASQYAESAGKVAPLVKVLQERSAA